MSRIGKSSTIGSTARKGSRSARQDACPALRERHGALQRLLQEAADCTECPSLRPHRQFAVGAHGTAEFGLMLIGEAPGHVSLDRGQPFSNPRNAVLRAALLALAHPRFRDLEDLFYLTDVVKCHPAAPGRPHTNRSPSGSEVATCARRFLDGELAAVRPSHVIAVGRLAAQHLLQRPVRMVDVHGSWYRHARGYRVLPLMHPSPRNRRGLARVGMQSTEAYCKYLTRVFRALARQAERCRPDSPRGTTA